MTERDLFLKLFSLAKNEGRSALLEHESADICRAYGIPVPDAEIAETKEEAIKASSRIGFPVVLKVISPQILHKSDVGGVKVGLRSKEDVSQAYDEIFKAIKHRMPKAQVKGVLVANMVTTGIETIVGLKRDPVFGSVVMFGMGGVFVEVYRDVAFRICPIEPDDAKEMIHELRGRALLEGFRGRAKANTQAIEKILLATCRLGEENPEVESIDLNPAVVDDRGAMALDTRIILT